MNPEKGYEYFSRMKSSYAALYDDISRELYFLRLALDLEFNPDIICQMVTLCGAEKRFRHFGYDVERVSKAIHDNTPIMIYGAGINGQQWYRFLKKKHAKVIGFYDKNYKNISSIMGLQVSPPPGGGGGKREHKRKSYHFNRYN